ncbi:MAG: hypothetical protein LAT67_13360 [Balneolales bacterium]|nr:hypothetical protein [Balneolales bacterium]
MIENGTFLAKTHPGLESLLRKELEHCKARYLFESEGLIRFQADDEELYRFLLGTRVCTGFELQLSQPVDITSTDLRTLAASVKWIDVLPVHCVFKVQAFQNEVTNNSLRALAIDFEKQICSIFQKQFEASPKPAGTDDDPEFVINIQINENGSCILTLDAGGEPILKRGELHNETTSVITPALAAGLIQLSGWDPETHFIDPFSNNGVFLIEAARIAKHRTPLFENDDILMKKWRTFRHALWKKTREEIVARMRKDVNWIFGSDSSYENISRIQYLTRLLRLNSNIRLRTAKANTIYYPDKPGTIITAPPPETSLKLLGDFGRIVREQAGGYRLGVFSNLNNADTILGMKPTSITRIVFNSREYHFLVFDIFKPKGSSRSKSRQAFKPSKTDRK